MITVQLVGRLGNQMFQYAVCRLIAEKRGYNFYISKENSEHGQNISNYFDLDMGIKDGVINKHFFETAADQSYKPQIFNIDNGTIITGYFQSEKYFLGDEEKVKSWFKIEMDTATSDLLNKYPVDDYCYIHFRGTDYINHTHWFLPKRYYDDAMTYISSIYNKKFLVITDDIETAKNFFDCEIISNDMMIDFKLLYYSKYSIITNSSFSWWSSWLSDKRCTIAPNFWFNYNNPSNGFDPFDIKTNKFIYL